MCAPSGKDHWLCCPPQPTTKLFIDGKFVESKTTEWIDIHNPVSEMASAHIPNDWCATGCCAFLESLVKGGSMSASGESLELELKMDLVPCNCFTVSSSCSVSVLGKWWPLLSPYVVNLWSLERKLKPHLTIFHIERLCECDVNISEGFLSSCMYATRYDLMPAECEVLIKLQNISDKSLKFPLGNQHFIDSFLCAWFEMRRLKIFRTVKCIEFQLWSRPLSVH